MIKIILEWNPISTQNAYWQWKRSRYLKPKARETKNSYIEQVKEQYKWNILQWDLIVEIDLYFIDKRRRDRDNRHKISIDSMEWIVFEDDKQIQQAIVTKYHWTPRIEINIIEI